MSRNHRENTPAAERRRQGDRIVRRVTRGVAVLAAGATDRKSVV